MNHHHAKKCRTGFGLFELLVLIAFLAMLLGLGLAAVNKSYQAAHGLQCKNNLKQIGLAIFNYEAANNSLPNIQRLPVPPGGPQADVSVFYPLLPYLELDELTQKKYPDAAATRIVMFTCPEDNNTATAPNNYAFSNYALNQSVFRGSPAARLNRREAMESSSSTIMAAERLQMCGKTPQTQWADQKLSLFSVTDVDPTTGKPSTPKPSGMMVQNGATAETCNKTANFQSGHAGQLNVLRGDGGITVVPSGFDAKSLNFYCAPLGREDWASKATFAPLP